MMRMPEQIVRPLCQLLCALCLFTVGAAAGAGEEHDHDRARQALEAGEILPLRVILDRVERSHPGQVIDVELERDSTPKGERWVYKIKLLRSGGSLVRLKVDARDGEILGSREHERR